MNSSRILDTLGSVVGLENVRSGDSIATRQQDFWSSDVTAAKALVCPGSVDELSRVLALCNEARQTIIAEGGRTNLVRATRAGPDDILVSLERMAKISEPDVRDATVVAEAGAIIQNIQEACEVAGLRFGLDFGARGSAVLGGSLATNAGGFQALRYGVARDQVLGLEVVLADGTVLSHLSSFRKDNTGYDLKQLFIGSEGTLGIITKAVMRLHPAPTSVETAIVSFRNFDAVIALMLLLKRELARILSSFEIMWREFFEFNVGCLSLPRPPVKLGEPFYVLCEAEGFSEEEDKLKFEELLTHAIDTGMAVDVAVAQSGRERREFWSIREVFDAQMRLFTTLVDFDLSLPIGRMEAFANEVADALATEFPEALGLHILGHLGDGNLHVATGVSNPENKRRIADRIYEIIARHEGSISAEHGIGLNKKKYLPYSRSEEEIKLMRGIKSLLDPKNILNPGKIF